MATSGRKPIRNSAETGDYLHYGAPAIARRIFGEVTPSNVRTVYYWTSEIDPKDRPEFLIKLAGRWCAWESQIREFGTTPEGEVVEKPAEVEIVEKPLETEEVLKKSASS